MKIKFFFLFCLLLLAACNGSGPGNAPDSQVSSAPAQSQPFVASNPAANLGPELLADPGAEGSFTGGLNDTWHFEGAVQPVLSTAAHTGNYAQQVQLSIYNAAPSNASADLWTSASVVIGQWYRASLWAKRLAGTAGDVFPWIYAQGGLSYLSQAVTSSDYAQYVCTALATANYLHLGVNNYPSVNPSDTVVIDDASVRAIPLASMVSLQDEGNRYGKAVANLTMQIGTQTGIVFCADSAANPQNLLLAYHDGTQIHFYQVNGGSYTSLPTGAEFQYYNASTNPAVAYVPGAALEVQRAPGSDLFSIYYNGRYVWQETVTDPVIVNNTVHGLFSTFEGNRVNFSFTPVSVAKKVVFLGGSITNGTGATPQNNGWQWLLRDYLDTDYADVSWSYTNAAVGGTDSWYSLIRLQTDALADAPDIIFVDEAVNDGELDPSNPAWPQVGEAIIRRIRTALPHCKIVICNFMRPVGSDATPDANTEKVRAAWNTIAGYYRCDLFRLDTALLGVLPANPTTAQIDGYFSGPGNVHPNNGGHALIFSGISSSINLLTENGWSGNLADYPRLNPSTAGYEAASTILSGWDLVGQDSSTGVWTLANAGCSGAGLPSACCTGVGTGSCSGVSSTQAGSTLSFTGGMVMVGLDVDLQNGSWPAGLQYALDGGAWHALVPQNSQVWDSEFMFIAGVRGAHTITLRLNSGTATINRLLVL